MRASLLSTTSETPGALDRPAAADIDRSCRWPFLALVLPAVCWLVLGTLLSLIVAIKFHSAGFLADSPWLTLGRLRPAATNCFLFGFASPTAMGVALWLLCRLGAVRLGFQWPLVVAAKLWHLGVLVGVWALLAGASTGFEWLEMPRYAAGILFVAYTLYGVCALSTFAVRQERELYPSQWFLLVALFWFPWVYSAANYLLVLDPVRGALQAAVAAWYSGNFLGMWLAPVCLAVIYYFVPKLTGQPLHSRELAAFAFWTLVFFGGFAGLASLTGGPVPRWLPSVGTAGTICMLVPLVSHALNWHWTNAGNSNAWRHDAILRFLLFGAACFLLHGLLSVVFAFPPISRITGLTYANVGRAYLALHGFVASVLFGAAYYILPRVLGAAWPKPQWIGRHFTLAAAGSLLLFVSLTAGGIAQGAKLANPNIPFLAIMQGTIPFIGMSTLGVLLLLGGQLLFLGNVHLLMWGFCRPVWQAICAECCPGFAAVKAGGKP
jgi:cytochrome c oxidase cbb3-type subunit 1